jgi:ubiquinone/menaquinone biosynthesis C-methylase UbiE
MEAPAVREAIGDVTGLRVVDLGCGDGSFASELLAAGCLDYVGVDGSALMIDIASQRPVEGARFAVADIEDCELPDGVDLVTARMVLHYVADLDRVLARVARALNEGGRLVFSVVHPVITSHNAGTDSPRTTWTVDHYFEPGPRRRSWFGSTVTWHHRTIEQYVASVQRAGLSLERLSECEPDDNLLTDRPGELDRRRRVPLILLMSALKRS